MTDEIRRSGRATKGQHTKDRDLPDTPVPSKRKSTTKKSSKAASKEPEPEDNGDSDAIIRCICGSDDDDEGGRMMICCDSCDAWQHNDCMGLTEDPKKQPDSYSCEQCNPSVHQDTAEALRNGIKIWELRLEEKKNKGKKGKKGSRKSRQSEIRSAVSEETASPKAQASSPAPQGQQKPESEDKSANGNAEVKSPTDSITTGKRRAEPDSDSTVKRRKSAQPKRAAESPALRPNGIDDLPEDRKRAAGKLRSDLSKLIKEASKRDYRIPDGETPDSLGTRLALDIEDGLMKHYPGGSGAYALQFRSIISNLPRNQSLLAQLLNGSITPEQLTGMSAEDMATEDRKRQDAIMKEQSEKQSILVNEEVPRYRKTHKGEEMIEDDNERQPVEESTFTAPPVFRRESQAEKEQPSVSPRGGSPMAVELPDNVSGERQPLHVDTNRRTSSNFDVNKIWSSVHSPDGNQPRLRKHHRQSSIQQPVTSGPGEDADVDRLLKDDENEAVTYSPTAAGDETNVKWRGEIFMPGKGSFNAIASYAGGGDVGSFIPYDQLIPQPTEITGRIDMAKTEEYIAGMRASHMHDVVILSLLPSAEGAAGFDAIFQYFYPRNRWGVIGGGRRHDKVRDVYIIPIPAGAGTLPACIEMLDNVNIEVPRPENMLLLMLVVRTGDHNSAQGTPRQTEMPASYGTPGTAPMMPGQGPPAQAPTPHVPIPMNQHQPGAYHSPHHHPPGASPINTMPAYGGPPPQSPYTPQQQHPQLFPPHPQSQPPHPQQQPHAAFPPHQQQPPLPLHSPPPGALQQAPPIPQHLQEMAVRILGPFITAPVVQMMLQFTGDSMKEDTLVGLKHILEAVPAAREDFKVLVDELNRPKGGQN